MRLDLSVLWFAQEFLEDVDLNDIETTRWLHEVSYLINKSRPEEHFHEMTNFRREMSKHCQTIAELQEETVSYLQETISSLFEEVALYQAMALLLQSSFSGVKEAVKENLEKRMEKEGHLRIVK